MGLMRRPRFYVDRYARPARADGYTGPRGALPERQLGAHDPDRRGLKVVSLVERRRRPALHNRERLGADERALVF